LATWLIRPISFLASENDRDLLLIYELKDHAVLDIKRERWMPLIGPAIKVSDLLNSCDILAKNRALIWSRDPWCPDALSISPLILRDHVIKHVLKFLYIGVVAMSFQFQAVAGVRPLEVA